MKIKTMLAALLLWSWQPAHAEEWIGLVLHLDDGTSASYSIKNEPKIDFAGDSIFIDTGHGDIKRKLDDVRRIEYVSVDFLAGKRVNPVTPDIEEMGGDGEEESGEQEQAAQSVQNTVHGAEGLMAAAGTTVCRFSLNGNALSISQLQPSEIAAVYSLNGSLVGEVRADGAGQAVVVLPDQDGIYLVRTTRGNYKIVK